MPKVDFNITEIKFKKGKYKAYQVRIVKQGEEHSKTFAWSHWGGKANALEAAQSWRDQTRTRLGLGQQPRARRLHTQNGKPGSTGVMGVQMGWHHDKRRDHRYYSCQVSFRRNGKAAMRHFYVGREHDITGDTLFHALRTAIRFRREYEFCYLYNLPFDESGFEQWKQRRVYDEPRYYCFEQKRFVTESQENLSDAA